MGFRTLCPKTKNTRGGGRGILLISQTSSLCLGDSVAIPSVVSFHPVNILLNEVECRVLGSLIEKEITTPEYYPLSLNALVNACNQKSNRDPVMNLDEAAVRQALHSLDGQSAASPSTNTASRKPSISTATKLPFFASCCYAVRKHRASSAPALNACILSTTSAPCNPVCST